MSIYANEQNVRKTVINIIEEFGVDGLVKIISKLEDRVSLLEGKVAGLTSKPKVGRPRKVVNG